MKCSWSLYSQRFQLSMTFFFQENPSGSGRKFFTFVYFANICNGVVLLDEIVSLLEISKFISWFVNLFCFSLPEFWNRSPVELEFTMMVNWLLIAFFDADDVSSDDRLFVICWWLVGTSWDVRWCVVLTTVWSFVDLEFNHLFVGVNKVLVLILVHKAVLQWELLDVSSTLVFLVYLL